MDSFLPIAVDLLSTVEIFVRKFNVMSSWKIDWTAKVREWNNEGEFSAWIQPNERTYVTHIIVKAKNSVQV